MTHLFLMEFGDNPQMGMWIFFSVGAVCLFVVFLPLVTWMGHRREEREAYYKAETFRRLAESTTDGAKAVLELLREQDRRESLKKREGMKIAGLVNVGVGIALTAMFYTIAGPHGYYMVGLIPGFIGVGLLIYAYFMAAPVE